VLVSQCERLLVIYLLHYACADHPKDGRGHFSDLTSQ
jgi:hypothetical protein